jgi:hypothetical protein
VILCCVGSFLWELLHGKLTDSNDTTHVRGTKRVRHYLLEYHAGKGISPSFMKLNRDFIILSLNGHSESTRTLTRAWLDSVKWREQRVKLLLILIGKESCDDAWIRPYMKSNGGVIDKLFIVYDSNVVDEVDIYQWPLGPALYDCTCLLSFCVCLSCLRLSVAVCPCIHLVCRLAQDLLSCLCKGTVDLLVFQAQY